MRGGWQNLPPMIYIGLNLCVVIYFRPYVYRDMAFVFSVASWPHFHQGTHRKVSINSPIAWKLTERFVRISNICFIISTRLMLIMSWRVIDKLDRPIVQVRPLLMIKWRHEWCQGMHSILRFKVGLIGLMEILERSRILREKCELNIKGFPSLIMDKSNMFVPFLK